MYAIKIISDDTTYLYLSQSMSYRFISCKNQEEFYSEHLENGDNVFIMGTIPEDEFEILKIRLSLTTHPEDEKIYYVAPSAWVYIMQEGKTIEVIRVLELQSNVEV